MPDGPVGPTCWAPCQSSTRFPLARLVPTLPVRSPPLDGSLEVHPSGSGPSGAARERPFHRVSGRIAAFFGDPRREVDVLSAHVFGYGSETPVGTAPATPAV